MRILRLAVFIAFVVVTGIFGFVFISEKITTDTTVPVITIDSELLEISVEATDEDILSGVTAYDEKDGDISDKVIIESISRFIETGVCKVTYAVCDSDNHVATASRKIRYTDYTSPRFRLEGSLCFTMFESPRLSELVFATDCLEGNITKNMILTSKDYASAVEGVFSVTATVSNSKGDSSEISLPMIVEERSAAAPVIELNEYLIYTTVGAEHNFKQYIESAMDTLETDITDRITIETDININQPGVYLVHYYATDDMGNRGHTTLTVIVEG